MSFKNFNHLIEMVVYGKDGKTVYSVPNSLKKVPGLEQRLVDEIEKNPTLYNLVISDILTHKTQANTKGGNMTIEPNAEDIWRVLGQTAVGKEILNLDPQARTYRISSERRRTLMTIGPEVFDEYDEKENSIKRDLTKSMPSFRAYYNDSSAHNLSQISGGGTKQAPPT